MHFLAPKLRHILYKYDHNLGIREFKANTMPVLLELDLALLSYRYTIVMSQVVVTIWWKSISLVVKEKFATPICH